MAAALAAEADDFPKCGTFLVRWQSHHVGPPPHGPFAIRPTFEVEGDVRSFVGSEALASVQKDLQLLSELLAKSLDESAKLLEAIRDGDLETARNLGKGIGLQEHFFVERGGGLWWLVAVAIGLAVVLVPAVAV